EQQIQPELQNRVQHHQADALPDRQDHRLRDLRLGFFAFYLFHFHNQPYNIAEDRMRSRRKTLWLAIIMTATAFLSTVWPETPPANWSKNLPRPSWGRFTKVWQSQDWFDVYQVALNVYAISEPKQWEEVISYLIVGKKSSVLFDTGLGIGDMKKLAIEIAHQEPLVVNSHSHYDHVGDNWEFRKVDAWANPYSEKNSKGRSHEDVAQFVGPGWISGGAPKDFSPDNYVGKPYTITPVHDGETFDLGDRTLEVVLTPGHSPDSVCLLDRKDRLLFTGDTFYPAALYAHL